MKANRAAYPVARQCRVLGVSPSGYYAWLDRAPSARRLIDEALLERIGAIHRASRGTYGAPRIHAELVETGWRIGRKRVARLMREAGLYGVSRRRWISTIQRRPDARPAPDLVARDFTADAPDQLYVAVRADLSRLFVPGGGARCMYSANRRLGDGGSSAHRAGARCAEHGLAPAAAEERHPSFR